MFLIRVFPRRSFISLFIFLGATVLYLFTMAPSITQQHFGTDSAELTATAYTLGVAHPPGYPTYIILAKIFSMAIPWGDVAHRINILSAVSGAGSVLLVYWICHTIIEGTFVISRSPSYKTSTAAFIGAAAFAVSPLPWSQSIIGEVYSLNALFTGGILLLTLRWSQEPRARFWVLALTIFLLGLGLGNHLTLLFVALPMSYIIVMNRGAFTLAPAFKLLIVFALGLSIYLYLPIRASSNPPINWGDTTNIEGFLWMIFAVPYQGLVFGLPIVEVPGRLVEWADLLARQFNGFGLFVGILGIWRLRVGNFPMLLFTCLLFLSSVTYSITYQTGDSRMYLTPAFMVFAIWIGVGTYWLAHLASETYHTAPMRLLSLGSTLFLTVFLMVPLLQFLANFNGTSLRGDTATLDYAKGVFQTVESDAVILAEDEDELFPLWYYAFVKEGGHGPTILSTRLIQFDWYLRTQNRRYPDVVPAGLSGTYHDRLIQIVEFNLGVRPVYITENAHFLLTDFQRVEQGNIYRILSSDIPRT